MCRCTGVFREKIIKEQSINTTTGAFSNVCQRDLLNANNPERAPQRSNKPSIDVKMGSIANINVAKNIKQEEMKSTFAMK